MILCYWDILGQKNMYEDMTLLILLMFLVWVFWPGIIQYPQTMQNSTDWMVLYFYVFNSFTSTLELFAKALRRSETFLSISVNSCPKISFIISIIDHISKLQRFLLPNLILQVVNKTILHSHRYIASFYLHIISH